MRTIDELGISKTPWNVVGVPKIYIHSQEEWIANTRNGDENCLENARLIATAPELYKALYDIVQFGQWVGREAYEAHERAREVLAKASGEEVR